MFNLKNDNNFLIAADNMHDGEILHDIWSEKIYNKYLESL